MNETRYGIVSISTANREKKVLIFVLCTSFALTLILCITPVAFGFPLTTEDTRTLGHGRTKIELNAELGVEQMNGSKEVSVSNEMAIVHGLLDNLNGFITLPYRNLSTQKADGSSNNNHDYGDAKFGLKWRYYEQGNLSLGAKGIVTAATGDTEKKLGNGLSTYSINAIASFDTAPLEFHCNLGYTWLPNTLGLREWIGNISTAIVVNLNRSWKVMADMGVANSKSSNEEPLFWGAGLSYAITKVMTVDAGMKQNFAPDGNEIIRMAGISVNF